MQRKMKTMMAAIAVSAIALFSGQMKAQTAESKFNTVEIKTSAVCGMCKKTIESGVYQAGGVKTASLDVASKVVTVTYNTEKTSLEAIKKAINLSGYDADELPADEKAYENLHGCCKKDVVH